MSDSARGCEVGRKRVRTGQKLTGLSLIKAMEKRLKFWLEECRKSPTLLAVHFHVGADSAKSTCTSTIVLDDLDEMLQVAAPHNVLQKPCHGYRVRRCDRGGYLREVLEIQQRKHQHKYHRKSFRKLRSRSCAPDEAEI